MTRNERLDSIGSHMTGTKPDHLNELQKSWSQSATAPPPAAAGPSPGIPRTQPPAAFYQQPGRDNEILKAIRDLRQDIDELKESMKSSEPAKPGFDKKGKFTPAGPNRQPEATTSGSSSSSREFMQSALAAFVHNMRTA